MAQYHITQSYTRQYADPISFAQGEAIVRERKDDAEKYPGWWWCTDKHGKSGWVHEVYLEEDDHRFIGKYDYNARELTVHAGDMVEGMGEIGGWLLARKPDGAQGWVPLGHVQLA